MPNPFTLQAGSLTLGEYAALEEITGWTYPQLLDAVASADASSPAFVLGLQFLVGRRADPAYSLVDAGRVRLTDLDLQIGGPDGGS